MRTNRSGGSISAVHPLRFAGERYLLTLAPKQRRSRGLLVALFLAVGGFGSVIWLLRRSEARGEELQSRLARLGHYELEGKIGEGAMATVYKARHALLKRPTAIKIANAELPAHLFEREVRLQSALSHPNTTTVYDFGQGDNGQLYCAMEYIEGYDLDRLVRLFGPLPPARAIRILSQVAASLSEAHQKMFIHQDIKPKNIMITERGNVRDFVKVLDFGLARVRPAEPSLGQTNASTAGQFLGTPGFAAPEIAAGARGSPASDIFSLGAVGYFLLTGRGPFEDPGLRLVTSLSVEERSAALPSHVPWPLASLVAQCLSRSPPERPLKMTSIVERLRAMNATITPWTADDAEQWWRDHPPSVTPSSQSSKSFPLPV